ncbi:hypothetical protein ACROYT_G014828 [Oculina patagonica]
MMHRSNQMILKSTRDVVLLVQRLHSFRGDGKSHYNCYWDKLDYCLRSAALCFSKNIQVGQKDRTWEDKLVVMLGGLHIEQAAIKAFGTWFADSEWVEVLSQVKITTTGKKWNRFTTNAEVAQPWNPKQKKAAGKIPKTATTTKACETPPAKETAAPASEASVSDQIPLTTEPPATCTTYISAELSSLWQIRKNKN